MGLNQKLEVGAEPEADEAGGDSAAGAGVGSGRPRTSLTIVLCPEELALKIPVVF